MRDNWNTDELSDQAWAQMREMLDREMPVDGRSRKPAAFWWFWLAAAVLLVGTIAMLWFKPAEAPWYDRTQDNDEIGIQQQQIANKEGKDDSAPLLTPEKQNKIENQTSKAAVVAGDPLNTNLISKARSSLETPPVENNIFSEPDRPEEINGETDFALRNMASGAAQGEEEKNGPLNEEDAITQEIFLEDLAPKKEQKIQERSIPEADQQTPRNPLDKIALSRLPVQVIKPLDQQILPLSRIQGYNPKKPLFVPLEINAGLIAGLESGGITGIMTELRTGLKLNHTGKWSLLTGIGLHLQREPFRVNLKNSGSLNQADVATPDTGNQNGSDPQAQDTSPMSLSQVLESSDVDLQSIYFDVPILLNWQFSRHWSLAAGGRMSWLLGSSWERNNSTNESLGFAGGGMNVALSNSGRQYVIQQSGNNSAPTTLVLNDFFAAGTLGISFRPNVNWNIRLQYQHSLSNQLENTTYRKTDRSLWLSAGLRF